MTRDKWEDIVELVEKKFELEESGSFEDEYDASLTEYLIFESQFGRVKLEFITKPKVVDKKVSYSNRIGSEAQVEYLYSPTEKTHRLLIYRWSEDDNSWLALEAGLNNFFLD